MAVEVLQEGLERRDQLAMQGGGVAVGAPLADQPVHMRLMTAEAGVHLQPEGRGLVEASLVHRSRGYCVAQIQHLEAAGPWRASRAPKPRQTPQATAVVVLMKPPPSRRSGSAGS
jgi:hypothetical protein